MIRAFASLTSAALLAFSRDRSTLIWSFLLPILLIFLFGSLSGSESDTPTKIPIGIVVLERNQAKWVADSFDPVTLFETHRGALADEKRALEAGQRRIVVIFPKGFAMKMQMDESATVRILYDPRQPQTSKMALSVAHQVIAGINQRLSGQPALLETAEEPLRLPAHTKMQAATVHGLDFVLPGLLGLTTLQLGLFTAVPFISMRQKGILKRLRATPLPGWLIVGSQITHRVIINFTQTTLILVAGSLAFHFRMACSPLLLLAVLLPGTLLFISIGMILSAVARTEEAGASLVQVVNMPLLLFSGLLIPIEILPAFLQPIQLFLPTAYFGDALRQVLSGTTGSHSLAVDLSVLVGWFIVSFLLAVRFFRWE